MPTSSPSCWIQAVPDFQYSTPKTEHHATHVHAKQECALLTSLVTAILVVYIVLECARAGKCSGMRWWWPGFIYREFPIPVTNM